MSSLLSKMNELFSRLRGEYLSWSDEVRNTVIVLLFILGEILYWEWQSSWYVFWMVFRVMYNIP
jgi:hypothetical protein